MPITLYGLNTCDTCKAVTKELEAAGKPAVLFCLRADIGPCFTPVTLDRRCR
jgi:arsenate reductase-like glutaredoxin family protein